jgi:hypothetical protein
MDRIGVPDRLEVELAQGPLDESELNRIRERILIRGSDFDVMEDRQQTCDSKVRRIWLTLTTVSVIAVAWMDGRFGFSAPNAVPVTPGAVMIGEAPRPDSPMLAENTVVIGP